MFRTLLAVLKPHPQPAFRPYGLDAECVSRLRRLVNSEAWDDILEAADAITAYQAEVMLLTDSTEQLQFMRGYLKALRDFPITLTQIVRESDAAGQRTAGREARNAADRAALYGTSAWTG